MPRSWQFDDDKESHEEDSAHSDGGGAEVCCHLESTSPAWGRGTSRPMPPCHHAADGSAVFALARADQSEPSACVHPLPRLQDGVRGPAALHALPPAGPRVLFGPWRAAQARMQELPLRQGRVRRLGRRRGLPTVQATRARVRASRPALARAAAQARARGDGAGARDLGHLWHGWRRLRRARQLRSVRSRRPSKRGGAAWCPDHRRVRCRLHARNPRLCDRNAVGACFVQRQPVRRICQRKRRDRRRGARPFPLPADQLSIPAECTHAPWRRYQ